MKRFTLKSGLSILSFAISLVWAPQVLANQASAEFHINGQAAKNSDAPNKASSNIIGGAFHIYVYGYIAPDSKSRMLDLWVKNFDEKTGEFQATATYHLRDEANREFLYASKPLSIKVKITEFKLKQPGNPLSYASISGEFQGELLANVADPQMKKLALAQGLKINSGSFKNVNVTKIN